MNRDDWLFSLGKMEWILDRSVVTSIRQYLTLLLRTYGCMLIAKCLSLHGNGVLGLQVKGMKRENVWERKRVTHVLNSGVSFFQNILNIIHPYEHKIIKLFIGNLIDFNKSTSKDNPTFSCTIIMQHMTRVNTEHLVKISNGN